ncbi:annexin-B12-like isoform X2 [Argonauta hians]
MATITGNSDFDCEAACHGLRDAMDGLGTNETAIIEILVAHNMAQRQEIKTQYKQSFGQDVVEDLKSELSGNFEQAIVALFDTPREFDAHEIHRAVANVGTEEGTLIEIMVTRPNEEIEEIKEIYEKEYETKMEKDLESDTSGNFRRLLVSLCTATRDTDWFVDHDKAKVDARRLFDAGEGTLGTDECTFNEILCQRTLPQLNETFEAYAALGDKSIRDAICDETSGAVQEGYLAIVDAAENLKKYFAQRLYNSMSGLGTGDNDLIRVIVSRSEIDLADIKEYFEELYGQSLADFIDSDCSGDYKTLLLAMIK